MSLRADSIPGLILALTVALPLAAALPASAEPIFPFPVHRATLDNGLQVIVVPYASPGVVAYYTVVRTGSRDEVEPGHSGFAHFFEHMMFRGTEKYPEAEYGRMVTRMGADANAFTSDDLTAYHLSIAAEDLGTVMEIESDRFRNLAYTEEAFRTEAKAAIARDSNRIGRNVDAAHSGTAPCRDQGELAGPAGHVEQRCALRDAAHAVKELNGARLHEAGESIVVACHPRCPEALLQRIDIHAHSTCTHVGPP